MRSPSSVALDKTYNKISGKNLRKKIFFPKKKIFFRPNLASKKKIFLHQICLQKKNFFYIEFDFKKNFFLDQIYL